jgi:hypothetical protein
VPRFCVSFALDSSSKVQVIEIECPHVTEVYQHLQQRFPTRFDRMLISAILEYRQLGGPAVAGKNATAGS